MGLSYTCALWLILSILLTGKVLSASDSPCSPSNRESKLAACLRTIKSLATFSETFWFSSAATTDGKGTKMMERMALSSSDVDNIDRYIDVQFMSPPGNYSSCGNVYTVTSGKNVTIDPTLEEIYYPWETRLTPTLHWTYDEGSYYTLLVYDVGYFFYHGVFFNIQKDDVANSTIAQPYHGPLVPRSEIHPYAFLLFRQSGRLSAAETAAVEGRLTSFVNPIKPGEIVRNLGLSGPLAINWMTATKDSYSIGQFVLAVGMNYCPSLVTEALQERTNKSRSFLKPDDTLSVLMDIKVHVQKIEFSSCCVNYSYQNREFRLNPLGDGLVEPAEVRTNTPMEVTLTQKGVLRSNFTGKLYTLLCFDPDVPYASAGSEDKPLAHWIVLNIKDGNVSSGDTVARYFGPAPPIARRHTYYFFLYEQNGQVNTTVPTQYTPSTCSDRLKGRCNFDIRRFRDDNSLTLVGATWMEAEHEQYVRHMQVQNGKSEADVCRNQTEYTGPSCPPTLMERTKALQEDRRQHNRSFIGESDTLSVPVDIMVHTEKLDFRSCCVNYTVPSKNFTLNPLGQNIKPAEVRTGTPLNVALSGEGILQTNLTGKIHTLICIDPDVPLASTRTNDGPLAHWILVNIHDGNVSTADVVANYKGPAPPDHLPHSYYFLLYEQNGHMNTTVPTQYASQNCSGNLTGRCNFDIRSFKIENSLTLVGAAWMTSQNDEYVRYMHLQRGDNEKDVCRGQPEYTGPSCPPKPASGANHHTISSLVPLLLPTVWLFGGHL